MPQTITAETFIDAPPSVVRSVILDFDRYPEWARTFLTRIDVLAPPADADADPKEKARRGESDGRGPLPGTRIRHNCGGTRIEANITVNSHECFEWYGPTALLSATHTFRFEAREVGGTRLVQNEVFEGPLNFVASECALGVGGKIHKGFDGWNAELKERAEKLHREAA